MIWPPDPAACTLLTWFVALSVLACSGFGLALRAIAACVGLSIFSAVYWLGYSQAAQPPLFLLGTGAAVLLATLGPASMSTSLGTLCCAAVAIAGLAHCPVGWIGLLHHVGLIGITAHAAACCYLLTFTNLSTSQEASTENPHEVFYGVVRHLSRRSAWLLILLTIMVTVVLVRETTPLGLPRGLGIWLLLSECLAGTVAWRVLHQMRTQTTWPWHLRVGLLVAGLGATIGLLVVPFALSSAILHQ